MLLLIALGFLSAVGVLIAIIADEVSMAHAAGVIMSVLFGIALIGALITLPINYHSTKAEVDRYHALKETIEKSRNGEASEVERAALAQEIAEYNKGLASFKYWNETIFDIYIYDGLAELEYLE